MKLTPWFEDPLVLKRTRQRLGLSQAALAAECQLKRSMIADLEQGRRRLKKNVRTVIWRALVQVEERETRDTVHLLSLIDARTVAEYISLRRSWDAKGAEFFALAVDMGKRIGLMEKELATLKEQNRALREWLDAEQLAALQHAKAAELSERAEDAVPGDEEKD